MEIGDQHIFQRNSSSTGEAGIYVEAGVQLKTVDMPADISKLEVK